MSLVGKIKTLFSDKEKTEPMFPRTKVKAVSDDEGVGLNVILENMVYSSEMVDGTSTVPVNADTLGGRPADEYALGVEVDTQVDELRTELQADIDGLTYADVGAAPQATVTSVLSAKGWYRVGMVAARYNDNAGGAAFRITVGSVYNNFINSTSIVEGVSSYDNGQLSTLFSWGGGYPITSVRLCQVSESQKASVYIDIYYNQSNTNNCFVTVDTTTGTFTPNSALTAVTTSETVVCETTLSGRYPFTTAHTIPIANGGTGATTAANALTNLGGISKKLVWTNASPNSSFAKQTVSITNGSSYDGYEIVYKQQVGPDILYVTSGFMAKDTAVMYDAEDPHYGGFRQVQIYPSSLLFSAGFDNAETQNNEYMIPYKIYGIKGVQ